MQLRVPAAAHEQSIIGGGVTFQHGDSQMLQSFVLVCYSYFFVYDSFLLIYFINLRSTFGMISSSL